MNCRKIKDLEIISALGLGISLCYFGYKLYKYLSSDTISNTTTGKKTNRTSQEISLNADEVDLVREQLKRNYEFFKEDGMKNIINSYVVVVGIGGVGR
jgi:hypothetical protein